jgi:hypothetical protein
MQSIHHPALLGSAGTRKAAMFSTIITAANDTTSRRLGG